MNNVIEYSKKLWESFQKKDIESLENMIHDDAKFVHMGVTLTKNQELDTIKNRRIVYQTIEFQESTISIIDSVSIVLNKLKLTAIVGGNEVTNPFVVTEVYIEKEDSFKLVSLSFTKIIY